MANYIDKNGYERGKLEHSDLIHRQIAYKQIYLKNKKKYPLEFGKYVVHHIDGNKRNNKISNLQILTKKEHEKIHGIIDTEQTTISQSKRKILSPTAKIDWSNLDESKNIVDESKDIESESPFIPIVILIALSMYISVMFRAIIDDPTIPTTFLTIVTVFIIVGILIKTKN